MTYRVLARFDPPELLTWPHFMRAMKFGEFLGKFMHA